MKMYDLSGAGIAAVNGRYKPVTWYDDDLVRWRTLYTTGEWEPGREVYSNGTHYAWKVKDTDLGVERWRWVIAPAVPVAPYTDMSTAVYRTESADVYSFHGLDEAPFVAVGVGGGPAPTVTPYAPPSYLVTDAGDPSYNGLYTQDLVTSPGGNVYTLGTGEARRYLYQGSPGGMAPGPRWVLNSTYDTAQAAVAAAPYSCETLIPLDGEQWSRNTDTGIAPAPTVATTTNAVAAYTVGATWSIQIAEEYASYLSLSAVQWWPGSPWRPAVDGVASWTYSEPGTYLVTIKALAENNEVTLDPITVTITESDIASTPTGAGGSTMSTFLHGVYNREEATSVIAPIVSSTAIPFVVGTAPVHTVAGTPSVNNIVKFSSWDEVVATFGDVKDFARYSLMEFLYAAFRVYGVAPVYCVNVFDPADIDGEATARELDLVGGTGTVPVTGVLVSEVTDDEEGTTTYVLGTDYTLSYSVSGEPIITRVAGKAITSDTATVFVHTQAIPADYCGVDADAVTAGLQLIDQVYAQYGDVPAHIAAPGFAEEPEVGVIMAQKAAGYGGGWSGYALTDIPADTVTTSSAAYAWKTENGYTSQHQDVCWPLAKIGDDTYHMSTVMACVLAQVDTQNNNVPYVTGSNYPAGVTAVVLADGTPVYLTDEKANDDLNAKGITTIIRYGSRGLVLWGNYTAAYPGSSDPLFVWRNYRRMFNWLENTIRLTMMQKVDQPGNLRQIESIVNAEQIYLNGLAAQGALIGQPKVEFRREDNPTTSLMNGQYTFRTSATPPTAMQAIINTWVVDVAQFATLFSAE